MHELRPCELLEHSPELPELVLQGAALHWDRRREPERDL